MTNGVVTTDDGAVTVTPGWIHMLLDVHRARWGESVAFWSSVTGWSASVIRGESHECVTFLPSRGDAFLKLRAVDGQAHVQLDLQWTDRSTAVDRVLGLGAQPAGPYNEVASMRSPGGLRFLNTLEEHPHRLARSDSDGMLDQVCLDIPAPLWEGELAFWKALTGRELEHGLRTEFALLADPDPHGAPRILLQRLDSSHGQVDAHLDFAVADRARQTARHAAAGAQVVNVMGRWTVMRAPDRHVYCLTDRDPASGRVRP